MSSTISLTSFNNSGNEIVGDSDLKFSNFDSRAPTTVDFHIHSDDRVNVPSNPYNYSECDFVLPTGGSLQGVVGYQVNMFTCENRPLNIISGRNNVLTFATSADNKTWTSDVVITIAEGDYSMYEGTLLSTASDAQLVSGLYTDSLSHRLLYAMSTSPGSYVFMYSYEASTGIVRFGCSTRYMRIKCLSTDTTSMHKLLGYADVSTAGNWITSSGVGTLVGGAVQLNFTGELISSRSVNIDIDMPMSIALSSDVWSTKEVAHTDQDSSLSNWFAMIPYVTDTATNRILWVNPSTDPSVYSAFNDSKFINKFRIRVTDEYGRALPRLGRWLLKMTLFVNR